MKVVVNDIIQRVTATVPGFRIEETGDTLKAGRADATVRGIVVTMMTTRHVLDEAVRLGANFIVTHEPTYYNDDRYAALADDPIVASKAAFIHDHDLIIWRCHDCMHSRRPDWILEGVARQLGWLGYQQAAVQELFDLPATTLEQLIAHVKNAMGLAVVRVIGEDSMPVHRVAVSCGCPMWDHHRGLLREEGVDVLVCGETREWETCEYVRDTAGAGICQAMIVLGHLNSEEAGMEALADWITEQFPGTPVHFVPAGDPFRLG